MAACLRGKTQILLGPKFKLELFYSVSLCPAPSLPLPLSLFHTHIYTLHSQNLTAKKKRTQLMKELGLSQMRTNFGRLINFSVKLG